MTEAEFIAALRRLPLHPGARGLADDAAVVGGLVVTSDTLVEGVHFLPSDPPADVAWKLVSVNLSDLAAKGAAVEGVLLNYPLRDGAWDRAFVAGFGEALAAFGTALIGGDTVSLPAGAPRVLTLTALGRGAAPSRAGARAGDALWVTGTIGDAGAGLRIARGEPGPAELLAAYRRPQPRLAEGRALGPVVHAMSDVSDGLLIDAARMAAASGLAVTVALDAVPLSAAYRGFAGDGPMAAATAGDDYQLLFALPRDAAPPVPATRVGGFAPGFGLALTRHGLPVPLPPALGWEHAGLAPAPPAP
jgi:thiamine-monophosphate kinase